MRRGGSRRCRRSRCLSRSGRRDLYLGSGGGGGCACGRQVGDIGEQRVLLSRVKRPDQLRARWGRGRILDWLTHVFGVSSLIFEVVYSLHEVKRMTHHLKTINFAFFPLFCGYATWQNAFAGVTCRRNLLAMRLSGDTSDCLHVKQMCSSESNKAVLIPENKQSSIRQRPCSHSNSKRRTAGRCAYSLNRF